MSKAFERCGTCEVARCHDCEYYHELLDVEWKSLRDGVSSEGADGGVSLGMYTLTVNEDKAKTDLSVVTLEEKEQIKQFGYYREVLGNQWVLLESLSDGKRAKLIKPSDASRYYPQGRVRMKAKIRKSLGRWYNCPALLLSLTFDPKQISRADAWRLGGSMCREFLNRVNRHRERNGYVKARCLRVVEPQKRYTQYPHFHYVFPYLKYLARLDWLTEMWNQGPYSVDIKVCDSMSPVSYVCKYISKMEGWSDLALSYLWANGTRLYSMSRDYYLPDYSDKRVPDWVFRRCASTGHGLGWLASGLGGQYGTVEGSELALAAMAAKEGGP